MKIALIGYGKMGKMIDELVNSEFTTHQITHRLNKAAMQSPPADLHTADIAIEFTQPDAAIKNFKYCFDIGLPVVSGTTAWHHHLPELKETVQQQKGKLLYATNFSIGVNIFFKLNKQLAHIMEAYPAYKIHINEIHHTEKKDAPSGTAISLSEDIVKAHKNYNTWALVDNKLANNLPANTIPIQADRQEGVKGTHNVRYTNSIDEISIKHTAFSRKGFALGAIMAAQWLHQQQEHGIYTMQDVLN